MQKEAQEELHFNIAAVERDTGLSKDTLRVWERRYGFPSPVRDEHGNRLYSSAEVDKLRLIRRLLDQGRRPARLVRATAEELLLELESDARPSSDSAVPAMKEEDFLQLVKLHRAVELRLALQQMLLKHGLQRFTAETLAALNIAVGQAWMRGDLEVHEEHLYSEQVQNVLRNAIGSHLVPTGRPRILLTTFPDELHGLGILMAQAMLAPEGANCVSLGTQTPLADIRNAAIDGRFEIVALSFSGAFPARQAIEGLLQLRRQLPSTISLWAGGGALAGKAARLPGIRVIDSLDDALVALGEWHDENGTTKRI